MRAVGCETWVSNLCARLLSGRTDPVEAQRHVPGSRNAQKPFDVQMRRHQLDSRIARQCRAELVQLRDSSRDRDPRGRALPPDGTGRLRNNACGRRRAGRRGGPDEAGRTRTASLWFRFCRLSACSPDFERASAFAMRCRPRYRRTEGAEKSASVNAHCARVRSLPCRRLLAIAVQRVGRHRDHGDQHVGTRDRAALSPMRCLRSSPQTMWTARALQPWRNRGIERTQRHRRVGVCSTVGAATGQRVRQARA